MVILYPHVVGVFSFTPRMTTDNTQCMAAQVRAALLNGEPQPFNPIAEVSEYLEPSGDYADLFEDGSVLFNDFVWTPENTQAHENWPLLQNIIEAWQVAKEDAEQRILDCPYDVL